MSDQGKAGAVASGGDGSKITTILQDVDLYASPTPRYRKQTGNPLPNPLRKGTKVKLFECRVDDWCHVEGGCLTGGASSRSELVRINTRRKSLRSGSSNASSAIRHLPCSGL